MNMPPSSRHALTLTPFYPTVRDDAIGCFIAEPLSALEQLGLKNSVLAAQPIYRSREQVHPEAPAAEFVRYASFPGGMGLASAGAFLFARVLGRVRELHQECRIDLIHAHAPLPCGHAAMLLSRELKIPYVVSVHGLDAYSTNQVKGYAGEWCRRISQRVFASAARVVCIGEHVRERVLEGGKATTSVLYNGADPDKFLYVENNPAGGQSILCVGNLIPIKGQDVLLRAVAAIATTHPDIVVNLVGDGSERGNLSALAQELKISQRVRFMGRAPRRDLARLMRDCTLFALPSRYEGLGCVYLEAMLVGKVAIGCRGQGIEEVIRHGTNGWLVEPGSVDQVASSLAMLLVNADLRRYIGEQARQTILGRFTLKHQAENLLRVYEDCWR
jgi:teichuronic acid biosynthesis glycosyltransferase TuaC